MKIGIIGAGNIGGNLTRRFRALGHDVSIANSRGPETLAALAKETGATPVTVNDAARGKDVVVVTIPERNVPTLPKDLFAAADGTVVVDTGNYYPQQRDGRIDAIENGTTESRWVAQQLRRPVMKAFNNIHAKHLLERGQPKGNTGRIALPVAGEMPRVRQWCYVSSMSSDLTASMLAPWMSHGGSSPAPRSTGLISTPTGCGARCPKLGRKDCPSFMQQPLMGCPASALLREVTNWRESVC